MSYPFVQAAHDYGPRKATLGLAIHGAEAESGVVGYLSRNPARGVSANFVCERSGRMVQMLGDDRASGAMNPADRSTDKAYYGHRHLVAVLGSYWTDPNAAVISVEGEWYAAKGPIQAQVDGLAAWAAERKAKYPTLRGAIGHADQTDTKGCPGSTPLMFEAFTRMGGHGLWTQEADMQLVIKILPFGGTFTVPAGTVTGYILNEATGVLSAPKSLTGPTSGHYDAVVTTSTARGNPFLRVTDGPLAGHVVTSGAVAETPNPAPPATDTKAAVNAALDKVRPNAIAGATLAIETAITGARP